MSLAFQDRHGVEVERIAGHRLKGPYATLAEQHVKITFAQDILGAHQKIFDRCRHSTLQHDRQVCPPHFPQKREILHVASANLQTVRVRADQLQILGIHYLGNDGHPGDFSGFGEKLQADLAQTLKAVW
jgi:hypothetical protein